MIVEPIITKLSSTIFNSNFGDIYCSTKKEHIIKILTVVVAVAISIIDIVSSSIIFFFLLHILS